jgi:hypothetical protein
VHSQYVHPKHPPDKEYRDDGPRDMNDPVASCFRFAKIEHAAMVAALAWLTVLPDSAFWLLVVYRTASSGERQPQRTSSDTKSPSDKPPDL